MSYSARDSQANQKESSLVSRLSLFGSGSTRRRLLTAAMLFSLLVGCMPLRVVTHTVSTAERDVPLGHYEMDPHHWSITFDVGHLKYSHFVMRFDRAHATLDWDEGGLATSRVKAVIDATSIDTNLPLLDQIVKGANMLDVEQFAEIRFISTRFERTGPSTGLLTGDLTIRGVTRPVTLDLTFNGFAPDPLTRQDTLGFSAQGHFSRSQFGLSTWFPAVGDEIRVRIEAEFKKIKPLALS